MSRFRVKPGPLAGQMTVPASKSHTLRSILFGALGKGKTIIRHPLQSADADSMLRACRLLGAKGEVFPDKIEMEGVNGKISYAEDVIDAGNSGIVLRFCSAVGSLASHPIVITGDESIRHQRPMRPLLDGLSQLGVSASSMRGDGYAPVIIRGPLQAGNAVIDGEDSQPVSALLIGSAFCNGAVELQVQNPGEKPWVAMTLNWFDRLGISYENFGYERYRLPGYARFDGFEYSVPGDFSSAAFPIAAALVTGSELTVKNVDVNDCQGDKELISVFIQMGANLDVDEENKTIRVKKGGDLTGIPVDINRFVDAITILAVVSCFANGETRIFNGSVAKQKECNRIRCISEELRKMGADIEETDDGLIVKKSVLKGAAVQSHQDHRMAMSLAVAGLGAAGETIVHSADCVAKTFPRFVHEFQRLKADIEVLR